MSRTAGYPWSQAPLLGKQKPGYPSQPIVAREGAIGEVLEQHSEEKYPLCPEDRRVKIRKRLNIGRAQRADAFREVLERGEV